MREHSMSSERRISLAAAPGLAFFAGAALGTAEALLYLMRYPGLRPMGLAQALVSGSSVGLAFAAGSLVPILMAKLAAARDPAERDTRWQLGATLSLLLAGGAGVMVLATFRGTLIFRHLPGGGISRLLAQAIIVALSLALAAWLTPRATRRLRRDGGILSRMAGRGWGLLASALSIVALSALAVVQIGRPSREAEASSPSAPNLILISIDTLRADHLGCYGYERPTSPNIDRLARGGVRFERAYTTWPTSAPGHASMLTGLYPQTHGVMGNGYRLSSVVPTLSEVAAEAGLRTGGFINNPWLSYTLGFSQGFETYFDAERLELASEAWIELLLQNVSLYRLAVGLVPGERQPATRLALRWIERHKEERFFLFLHLLDPHQPYHPDPAFRDRFLDAIGLDDPGDTRVFMGTSEKKGRGGMGRNLGETVPMSEEMERAVVARYDECVLNADRRIGELLDALGQLGLDDRSVVLLTSDHGENMADNQPRFNHEGLHQSILHIPFILRGPGVAPAADHRQAPVSLVDVVPTLADLGALEPPPFQAGVSLIDRSLRLEERSVLAIEGVDPATQKKAVATRDWKLVRSNAFGRMLVPTDRPEGLNPPDRDASDSHPELADSLEIVLEQGHAACLENAYPSEEGVAELDEERIEQLKALGYLN
ncbi:MAG: hypothetical protein CME06_05340 [Gemmatimonadetes bacterium]|nr:hypothetical protein [Gemmatimonadota bacterium]